MIQGSKCEVPGPALLASGRGFFEMNYADPNCSLPSAKYVEGTRHRIHSGLNGHVGFTGGAITIALLNHPLLFRGTTVSKSISLIPLLVLSSAVLAKDPVPDDSHTLDWPIGYDQAVEFTTGSRHNPTGEAAVIFDQDLKVAGAAWLQVHFQDIRLEGDSFVRLTSDLDGEVQEMDSAMLGMWRNHSAYFNGDSLRVELVADPATFNNEFTITHVSMEELVTGPDRGDGCGICGNDDRAPSDVDYAGRMMPVGCTSTVYNDDGCFVSAGHCLGSTTSLQFNVPASSNNCSLNHPPVADQFPIIDVDGVNGGVGDDYAAGRLGTNNLGQTHYERYGIYVPLAGTTPSNGTLEIWGYGVDDQCNRTQTQQYHSGSHEGLSSDAIYYDIDMTYGNSGSSIIQNNTIVGIVTHCSYECFNYGTRIDKNEFETLRAEMCDVSVGACCIGESCAVIPEANCGGDFLGDGTDCSSDPCAPVGACCVGTSCSVSTQADCGGDWLGGGSDCSASPCAPILGACCVGTSCSVIDKEDCTGTFLGEGTDCSDDPCAADPTGGCCNGTSCSITTQADCGGTYLGDGTNCSGNPCDTGGESFLGLGYSIVGSNLVDDAEPTWTVDVYAVLADNCRLDAVAGDSTTSKMVTSTTSFYQNVYGGNTSAAINPVLFDAFPDLRYDSFMTIGRFDSSDNNLSDIGIDFSNFENGGAIDASDGSWFVTPDDPQGASANFQNESCESGNGVLIARLTVRDLSASVYVEALFQGKDAGGDTWQSSGTLSIVYDDCNGIFCDGDFNQDGVVDVSDLLHVIANWGTPYDVADLLLVIADWGCTG